LLRGLRRQKYPVAHPTRCAAGTFSLKIGYGGRWWSHDKPRDCKLKTNVTSNAKVIQGKGCDDQQWIGLSANGKKQQRIVGTNLFDQ